MQIECHGRVHGEGVLRGGQASILLQENCSLINEKLARQPWKGCNLEPQNISNFMLEKPVMTLCKDLNDFWFLYWQGWSERDL